MRAIPTLVWVLALACSSATSPPDERDEVRFKLDGTSQVLRSETEYLSLTLTNSTFHLSAADYLRDPDLVLELSLASYHGPGTYPVGFARLVVGQEIFVTNGERGQGTLSIAQASCRTETVTDPATGITGPVTMCQVRGTFDLVAVSQAGAIAAVSEGSFNVSSVGGPR